MSNKIIKKGHKLVEANYQISLWEMRILLRMMAMIRVEDKDFQLYDIDVQDLKRFFGIENEGSVYKYIKEASDTLIDKKITIQTKLPSGKTKETIIPMIVQVDRVVEDKTLSIAFHPLMKPYLLELASKFLTYDVKNILKLKTSYAIRLYEITKAFVGIGTRTLEVDEIRRILGIEGKYEKYGLLKQRILKPSIKSINEHTDILLDFRDIKEGRSVAKVQFVIKLKPKNLPEPDEELAQLLQPYDISPTAIQRWRKKYDQAHITKRVQYMIAQDRPDHPIENPGAYLSSIMDKEIELKEDQLDFAEKLRRARAILFSRPDYEKQLRAKYGDLTDRKLVGVLERVFPERFRF